MRLHEFFLDEYTTKSGDEIIFKIKKDVEGDNNRGWIVHQIDAYVEGRYAGYLKIAYIPKERFQKWYPTILNYMALHGKTGLLPYEKQHLHYKDLSDEELKKTLRELAYDSREYHQMWNRGEGIPESREECIAIIEDIIKNELKEHKKKFKEFADYFIDNPYVDFIRVFERNELTGKERKGKRSLARKHYKRQRIGTALYLKGAQFLKKKGLMLRASTSQSDPAKDAWAHLEKQGLVLQKGKNRYVDPNKVD